MTNRYAKEAFESFKELGDGSVLEMRIWYFIDRRIYDTENVEEPEPAFRLDNRDIAREDLPPEITAQVIEELINSANPVPRDRLRLDVDGYD